MTAIAALEYGQVAPGNANYSLHRQRLHQVRQPGATTSSSATPGRAERHRRPAEGLEVSSDVYFINLGFRFFNTWNCGDTRRSAPARAARPQRKGYGIQNVAQASSASGADRQRPAPRRRGPHTRPGVQARVEQARPRTRSRTAGCPVTAPTWRPGRATCSSRRSSSPMPTPRSSTAGRSVAPRLASKILRARRPDRRSSALPTAGRPQDQHPRLDPGADPARPRGRGDRQRRHRRRGVQRATAACRSRARPAPRSSPPPRRTPPGSSGSSTRTRTTRRCRSTSSS